MTLRQWLGKKISGKSIEINLLAKEMDFHNAYVSDIQLRQLEMIFQLLNSTRVMDQELE